MARDRNEGVYVERPKADVYLALLILTSASLLLAIALMSLEYSSLQ